MIAYEVFRSPEGFVLSSSAEPSSIHADLVSVADRVAKASFGAKVTVTTHKLTKAERQLFDQVAMAVRIFCQPNTSVRFVYPR